MWHVPKPSFLPCPSVSRGMNNPNTCPRNILMLFANTPRTHYILSIRAECVSCCSFFPLPNKGIWKDVWVVCFLLLSRLLADAISPPASWPFLASSKRFHAASPQQKPAAWTISLETGKGHPRIDLQRLWELAHVAQVPGLRSSSIN